MLWIKPIVEEFFSWATDLCVLPNSKIGKAIEYALKYKEGFCTFLNEYSISIFMIMLDKVPLYLR